ncbi:hypothetical protein INR79_01440 [Vibrio sp. SCSIO 43132]|uniref:hypothetical protein n=1 Tax=Vibrio sp. SCSIO 43132 TaxID=2779363 RepID=UPI001CA847B7|nr:hypothetical protein [Vibrio sp. SCSIO 43132]UAB70618.1 hypothetical protein INR79_01440 [Vibrio sp. SCSIO 43132]
MKLSNLYLAVGAVLSAVSFTSAANACTLKPDEYPANKYPAHAQWSCSLDDWVSGNITPTINKTLSSAKPSVELFPENLELLGSISVRQSSPTFLVEKKTQNCSEIYQSFNRQEGKTANVTHCGSGAYQFEQSSHYSGSPHCRVAGNIETCINKELRVEAKSVDLRFKVPQASFGGELREIEKKNRIIKNLGLVPIQVGDITTFIPAEVTNLSPLPTRVTSRWGASGEEFTSEVIPSAYYELSCPNNSRVTPLKIPLVYKNDRLSEIGVHSDSGLSGFSSQAISNFATACGTNPAKFTVVNSQDISEAGWKVHLGITDNLGYIPELERLASILVAEAQAVIVERESLATISRGDMSIKDAIKSQISALWGTLLEVQNLHFFDGTLLPEEYRAVDSNGDFIFGDNFDKNKNFEYYGYAWKKDLKYGYASALVDITIKELDAASNELTLPNFEKLELFATQLTQEQGFEEPVAVEALFNPDFDSLIDIYSYDPYPGIHYATWNFVIDLAEINENINNSNSTNNELKAVIARMQEINTNKVLSLSRVIDHTLSVAEKAREAENKKIRELRAKLLEL